MEGPPEGPQGSRGGLRVVWEAPRVFATVCVCVCVYTACVGGGHCSWKSPCLGFAAEVWVGLQLCWSPPLWVLLGAWDITGFFPISPSPVPALAPSPSLKVPKARNRTREHSGVLRVSTQAGNLYPETCLEGTRLLEASPVGSPVPRGPAPAQCQPQSCW